MPRGLLYAASKSKLSCPVGSRGLLYAASKSKLSCLVGFRVRGSGLVHMPRCERIPVKPFAV
jgi:hypothetical protein